MQENKETFTTGEVAKLCSVSVRTVQFYDKGKIVSPSEISEGGRRIYTKDDVDDFRLACLYKSLGFSLKEIKDILSSKDKYSEIEGLLSMQKLKTEKQIQDLENVKEKLGLLQDELKERGIQAVTNEAELNNMLIKKEKHRKTDVMTYIFLSAFILIIASGFPLATKAGGVYPIAMLVITGLLLIGLIYYHSSVNAYICPNCRKKFTIGFFKDMVNLNGVKRGKYLKCPYCHHRAWMSETFKDE